MKTATFSITLFIASLGVGFAQTERLESGDSIRVELERQVVSNELKQLRDSINHSIHVVDSLLEKARGSKRESLVSSRKELLQYKNLVNLDIEETSTTARKAWKAAYVDRIRTNTATSRKEYKRICSKL